MKAVIFIFCQTTENRTYIESSFLYLRRFTKGVPAIEFQYLCKSGTLVIFYAKRSCI
jgi:hypothetical protein